MKACTAISALLAFFGAAPAITSAATPKPAPRDLHAEPLDADRMLWAIEQVEATPQGKIGLKGERSTFQITRAVWQKYSGRAFESASVDSATARAEARRVAAAHLQHIRCELAKWEIPDRPYYCGLAWNGGLPALLRDDTTYAARRFGDRCANMYFSNHSHE